MSKLILQKKGQRNNWPTTHLEL